VLPVYVTDQTHIVRYYIVAWRGQTRIRNLEIGGELLLSEIWCSYGGGYEDYVLLGYDAVLFSQ
jgi:hypothetical protein